MRFLRRLLFRLVLLGILAAIVAAVVIPGPQRALFPGTFGLTEIAPGIWTDRPKDAERLLSLAERTETRITSLFARPAIQPRLVLCTTRACQGDFGIPGRAMTLGDRIVVVGRDGLNPRTLLHERLHVELHARMGILDAIAPRFPSWFNEGFATHLSGTPDVPRPTNPRAADWITSADTPLAWRRMRQSRRPAEYYAAAARLVEELEDRIGRDGLLALVDRVADGADFDAEYRRALEG